MSQEHGGGLSLTMMRRYLSARGWRSLAATNPLQGRNFDLYVLSEQGSEDIEIPVPVDRDASDFARRIQDVIRTLSEVEETPPAQIISAIGSIGFDVVRSRIPELDAIVATQHNRETCPPVWSLAIPDQCHCLLFSHTRYLS
jgi:hypothetical protein